MSTSTPVQRSRVSLFHELPFAKITPTTSLRQTMGRKALADLQADADHEFFDEVDAERALQLYVQKHRIENVFFLDEDKQRYIYRSSE